jgi:uncharacterized membrane protein YfcA
MEISMYTLVLLCVFAFLAGWVDAIAGGGGLIQTPASLILLPQFSVASVIGSLKIPAFTGTSFAVFQYVKKVAIQWKDMWWMCVIAFISAFAGSELLSVIGNRWMKPIILIVLIGVAIFTYSQKNWGQLAKNTTAKPPSRLSKLLICCILGFYDGFIGPGAGSFLVLAFISILGMDFLHAGAHAKVVNLCTNLGSIVLFVLKGSILWSVAIPMSVSNGLGGFFGAKMALAKGNQFIRKLFLMVIFLTLLRFGYDVFSPYFTASR